MFINNLLYEIKLLTRSYWFVILLISIASLFAFATFNGNKNVAKRLRDISKMETKLNKKDSALLVTLSKLEKGEKVDLPYWKLPNEPMTIGYRHPRLATMKPQPLAFVATGQSDMYTHFKSPTVYGNNFALDYAEMVNPVQLLFGNFDLTFVIIYILPLLIIAFTFNVLSKEKELGILPLLGAQPISIIKWLLQKMTIRFITFTLITLGVLLTTIILFTTDALSNLSNLLGLFLSTTAYILFWFVISCIVNIKINNSSKNAVTLIGIWVLIILVLPATINQIGNSLYPTPSRLTMINEIRQVKKENEEKQDEIMDNYLRNHPEFSSGTNKEKFNFWHNYFASEKLLEEQTKPLVSKYASQLKQQQNLINTFKYISPAILMQQSLNNIAGTSEDHYNDFKKQTFEFSDTWRNYLVPMLFKEQKFNKKSYEQMPEFEYKNRIKSTLWVNLLAITLISCLLFFVLVGKNLKDPLI